MAKRKIDPKATPDTQPAQEESPGFTRSSWAGHEQFQCKHCAFDSLETNVMIEHLFWVHSILLTPPPTPPQIQETNLERGESGTFETDVKEIQDAKTNVD